MFNVWVVYDVWDYTFYYDKEEIVVCFFNM